MSTLIRIDFVSKPLTLMDANNVPREGDTPTNLFVYFKYTQDIAKSSLTAAAADINTQIRLYFVGIGSVYVKNDLGYGLL